MGLGVQGLLAPEQPRNGMEESDAGGGGGVEVKMSALIHPAKMRKCFFMKNDNLIGKTQ